VKNRFLFFNSSGIVKDKVDILVFVEHKHIFFLFPALISGVGTTCFYHVVINIWQLFYDRTQTQYKQMFMHTKVGIEPA
jgi:hypothetical protein